MNKALSCYGTIKFLYNINDLRNLHSIFKYGILSKNEVIKRHIASIDLSNQAVQKRRDEKQLIHATFLHDYASLYFNPRNPMMFNLISNKDLNNICIVCVDKKVLELDGVLVSDRNAASELAFIESPMMVRQYIDFNRVFAKYWTSYDPVEQYHNKQIQCAEVLILNKVPLEYLIGVIVCHEVTKRKVESMNLGIKVIINRNLFFQ